MKKIFLLACLFCFHWQTILAFPHSENGGSQPREKKEANLGRRPENNSLRNERRVQRFEAKWEKLKVKMKKQREKGAKELTEVWDDDRFRIGVILLGAAVALGILSILISLAGLINFIAGLLALGGVILIVWSLIEYYT